MKILSIDWDYFFPNAQPFDWGHQESPIFLELIWPHRVSSNSLITGKNAVDIYKPDAQLLAKFWERVLTTTDDALCVVADSHLDLLRVFRDDFEHNSETLEIWNFDAHHDLGYQESVESPEDCGNWAREALKLVAANRTESQYKQIYPSWRLDSPEAMPELSTELLSQITISHSLPNADKFPAFDAVFVCRSSAWTPSWQDHQWLSFLDGLAEELPENWEEKLAVDWVLKSRDLTLADAIELRKRDKVLKAQLMQRQR